METIRPLGWFQNYPIGYSAQKKKPQTLMMTNYQGFRARVSDLIASSPHAHEGYVHLHITEGAIAIA